MFTKVYLSISLPSLQNALVETVLGSGSPQQYMIRCPGSATPQSMSTPPPAMALVVKAPPSPGNGTLGAEAEP